MRLPCVVCGVAIRTPSISVSFRSASTLSTPRPPCALVNAARVSDEREKQVTTSARPLLRAESARTPPHQPSPISPRWTLFMSRSLPFVRCVTYGNLRPTILAPQEDLSRKPVNRGNGFVAGQLDVGGNDGRHGERARHLTEVGSGAASPSHESRGLPEEWGERGQRAFHPQNIAAPEPRGIGGLGEERRSSRRPAI